MSSCPNCPAKNAKRRALAELYRRELSGVPGLVLPTIPDAVEPVYHLYVVQCPDRDEVQRRLRDRGVGTAVHYPFPVHLQDAYRGSVALAPDGLPVTEALMPRILSLPMVSRTLRGRRRCRRRSRPRCRFLSDQGACMSSDTSGKPTITGLVLTYNGERLLGKCLESLAFCDAVIVVDSFSSDATESIAREHGATFVQHPWSGALPQFEYALGLVKTDWVVSLDQDEICSEPLRDAILAALPGAPADLCGFTPARRSWYYDRFLKHSGWYPDRLLRVFRRNGVHFTQSGAHEHIDPNGRTRELDGDILHYPYKHFREHLDKINSYAQQGADDLAARGKKGGLALGVLHGIGRFLRIYLLKKGFLDGKAGFINAVHGAFYAFLKYVRVDEGNWGFPYNHR